jgi:methylated-DNA-[protein]-cysteine S-methyltransferase
MKRDPKQQEQLFIRIFSSRGRRIGVASTLTALVMIDFPLTSEKKFRRALERRFKNSPIVAGGGITKGAEAQLRDYLAGRRRDFDLPVHLAVTPFQSKVLHEVKKIPYGETRSYGELARRIGNPRAARAVGGAMHANPLPLVIPCHRVIGADGSLVGFGGGLEVKASLLEMERRTRTGGPAPCRNAVRSVWPSGAG